MRQMFLCDWDLARQSHGLEKLIVKNDDRAAAALVAGGAEEYAEVDEVRETLWKFHKAIYGAFDYYAALFVESKGTSLECDVFSITFNGFLSFIRDCRRQSSSHIPTPYPYPQPNPTPQLYVPVFPNPEPDPRLTSWRSYTRDCNTQARDQGRLDARPRDDVGAGQRV